MDDIFSILIYLFIIISFLSSIFKKRNKEKEESNSPPPSSDYQTVDTTGRTEVPPAQTQSQQDTTEDYTILKEIEDMFKDFGDEVKTEAKIPQRDASEEETRMEKSSGKTTLEAKGHYSGEWHKPVKSEHRKTESEHSRTKGEHSFTTDREREKQITKDKTRRVSKKVEEQAMKMEKILSKSSVPENSYAAEIKSNLKNPRSIKEYIIVSEIIGKPKAFTE